MNSGTEPEANLDALETLAQEAASQGAAYALSPEVTVVFAENREGLAAVAGPWENNAAIGRCRGIARDTVGQARPRAERPKRGRRKRTLGPTDHG